MATRYSVRRRLTLALGAGFALLSIGCGLTISALVTRRATVEFDVALTAQAQALAALVEAEADHIEFDYHSEVWPQFERGVEPDYCQIWLADGHVLWRSAHVHGDLQRSARASPTPCTRDVPLPDGHAGRLVEMTFVPKRSSEPDVGDPGAAASPAAASAERVPAPGVAAAATVLPVPALVLAVARHRRPLDELIAHVRAVALLTSALVAGLAALFAWRALAAGFRPIDAIAAQVRGIDADALHARIRASDAPCEVAPVAQHLNDLLDRLAATFARERRFAGNLAHELRTPIAELRTLADVARKWPDDRAAVLAYFGDVKDIADRMHVVVGDLLLLARCQAGVEECAQAPVRIRAVLAAAWSHHAPGAARRALTWQCDAPDSLVLHTDAGKLAIILHNLVGNAVSHALHGSVVRCTVVPAGPGATLTISNRAARLHADDMARLTEPFWRKATGSDDVHVGLGLPLVVALTELLGLRVTLRQEDDDTFHAQVTGLVVAREGDGAARSHASTRDRAAS